MKVIFAGDSTGGHLMTGLSLAQEIKTIYPESKIIFFATSKPFEKECILEKGFLLKKLKYTTGSRGLFFQIYMPEEFIAAIIQHIPKKSFQMLRYYGLCKVLHKPYYAEFKIMLSYQKKV